MNSDIIKCHKCRHVLVEDMSEKLNIICDPTVCSSYNIRNFIHVQEDKLPLWIKSKIEEEQWTKGKLHCEHCGCKVGSFDFVSGRKCDCRNTVLPPVHFISSQVDIPIVF